VCIILGGEDEVAPHEVVLTFHPGAPLPVSTLPKEIAPETMTAEEAIEAGLRYAKVLPSA
jgi:hypothetical protein